MDARAFLAYPHFLHAEVLVECMAGDGATPGPMRRRHLLHAIAVRRLMSGTGALRARFEVLLRRVADSNGWG